MHRSKLCTFGQQPSHHQTCFLAARIARRMDLVNGVSPALARFEDVFAGYDAEFDVEAGSKPPRCTT